ncbi:MAG: superoxide dismutase [Planctomycetaceae bacterium]|nr:superoxide dismutase [Planctomycetaceae bacterium]
MYTLTKLPYAFDALEPYIDARTVEIHHTKHQQTYVDKVNAAIKDYPQLQGLPINDLIADLDRVPEAIRTTVRNNGGGVANHELYFAMMRPGKQENRPIGKLAAAIDSQFGGFDQFQQKFSAAAVAQFGSGWGWLSLDKQGKLAIETTPGHDTPVMFGRKPVLVVDVWEHAYYLKHQWRRADSIADWWHLINWDFAERNFAG